MAMLKNQRVTCINHPFFGRPNFDPAFYRCSPLFTGITRLGGVQTEDRNVPGIPEPEKREKIMVG